MNSVVIAIVLMLILALSRVHVVIAMFIGALAGGLIAGLGLDGTMTAFQEGLGGGAQIALSYALLGAFAMAVANSGLPKALADVFVRKLDGTRNDSTHSPAKSETRDSVNLDTADSGEASPGVVDTASTNTTSTASPRVVTTVRYTLIVGILAMAIMSQNLIPVHIAFIPLLIPPLLKVMNRTRIDRRLIACVLTFGLITTYMFVPVGFGKIFLEEILLGNIEKAGLDTSGINIMSTMAIPAAGMLAGLLVAVLFTYRKPRDYNLTAEVGNSDDIEPSPTPFKMVVSVIAIISCFGIQVVLNLMDSEADGLLLGALVGLAIFLLTGAVKWRESDNVFNQGMRMMAMIGFIMITAQGFASVITETGDVNSLVASVQEFFGDNQALAALAMLLVGLLITLGIGSSFSTLPIITTIYVPLCLALGFSPMATVALVGAAGAVGDAGSPASDSTLGPTAGLNADGQHDHIRDTVIPTFLHFNIPLIAAGWIAAMVL